jgi:hypothetical protein
MSQPVGQAQLDASGQYPAVSGWAKDSKLSATSGPGIFGE